jgi:outer membrane protein, heavy metal efflux system
MRRFFCLAGSLLLAGCAGSSDDTATKSARLEVPPASAAVNYAIPGGSGPDELARLAIRHHPSIAAARHRAQGLAEKIPQENALPDPMLELTAGPILGKSMDGREAMLELKQPLPFPGKRRESAAAASKESTAALAEVRALELNLTEQIHSAWWDLYLSQQTTTLTHESRSVLVAIRDAVDARVAADQATQADQIRLANEIAMVDRDLAEANELARTARARLNSLLNRPASSSLPTARAVGVSSPASLDSLLAQAQSRHPEVAAAQERAGAFQHRLKRAELERYPDFSVGVTGSSRDEVFGMVGITLPIWREPRRAMIREARAGIAETEAMIAATRADLRYRIEEAYYQIKTSQEIIRLFESRLIPDSKQAYDVTLTGYSSGTSNFTDLLETWRQTLAYRLQHARSQAQLGKAAATLKAASGNL